MPKNTRPSLPRLREIMRRQGGAPKWGIDYQPANRINTREAPRESRPSGILSPKLGGRYLVAQSKPERAAALLALYHPKVFEIHEQKILQVGPSPHPLFTHPSATGLDLPQLKGTVDVADRLGCIRRHPVVLLPNETSVGEYYLVPFPFIGDFLLFLSDQSGPYCINWTVKKSEDDFEQSMTTKLPHPKNAPPSKSVIQRHEIEETYYMDAKIPTYRVTLDKIDKKVIANLLNLHYWFARPHIELVSDEKKEQILSDYRRSIGTGLVQFEMAKRASKKYSIEIYTAKLILKQGIWTRCLRVNLLGVLGDNLPLVHESRDVLDIYSGWFAR